MWIDRYKRTPKTRLVQSIQNQKTFCLGDCFRQVLVISKLPPPRPFPLDRKKTCVQAGCNGWWEPAQPLQTRSVDIEGPNKRHSSNGRQVARPTRPTNADSSGAGASLLLRPQSRPRSSNDKPQAKPLAGQVSGYRKTWRKKRARGSQCARTNRLFHFAGGQTLTMLDKWQMRPVRLLRSGCSGPTKRTFRRSVGQGWFSKNPVIGAMNYCKKQAWEQSAHPFYLHVSLSSCPIPRKM